MLDDRKRLHPVKLLLTERELFDLSREANREDRTLAGMGHHVLRRFLYGSVDGHGVDGECCRGSESSPGEK